MDGTILSSVFLDNEGNSMNFTATVPARTIQDAIDLLKTCKGNTGLWRIQLLDDGSGAILDSYGMRVTNFGSIDAMFDVLQKLQPQARQPRKTVTVEIDREDAYMMTGAYFNAYYAKRIRDTIKKALEN